MQDQSRKPEIVAPDGSAANPRRISAGDLLGTDRVLQIEHNGQIYTLRLTRNDRLILTK